MLREMFEGPERFERRVAAIDLTTISDADLKKLYSQASPTYDTTSPANESIIAELERRSGKPIERQPPADALGPPTEFKRKPLSPSAMVIVAIMVAMTVIAWWNG